MGQKHSIAIFSLDRDKFWDKFIVYLQRWNPDTAKTIKRLSKPYQVRSEFGVTGAYFAPYAGNAVRTKGLGRHPHEVRVDFTLAARRLWPMYWSLKNIKGQLESELALAAKDRLDFVSEKKTRNGVWEDKTGELRLYVACPADLSIESDWPVHHQWLASYLDRFHGALAVRLQLALPLLLNSGSDESILPPQEAEPSDSELQVIVSSDRTYEIKKRGEQSELRREMFKGQTDGQCVVCGKTLPVELLITAHIKPRSICNQPERDDTANVVPMCLLGCDALFEKSYIAVNEKGEVAVIRNDFASRELDAHLGLLDRRPCSAYRAKSRWYFNWHCDQARRKRV